MNTRQGTVKGEMQGKKRDVEEMKVSATAVLRGKLGELAARGHWMAGLAPRCCCVFPARQAGHQSCSTLLPAVVPWLPVPSRPRNQEGPFRHCAVATAAGVAVHGREPNVPHRAVRLQ